MVQAEITAHSNGCLFRRADLHIHSYGPETGSYDVHDATMTPQAIVDAAIAEGLKVIAIADHNVIGNVRAAVAHAAGKDILVVSAVELSTQQGHLLVYFPTPSALESFYGKLTISPDKKACSETIPQALRFAADFGGFGICAHIDTEAGVAQAHEKFDAFKQEIFNAKNLLGLEIKQLTNFDWFAHDDTNADRKNCAVIRCKHLEQEEEIDLAKVMSSDAHTLSALGKNAAGNRRLTRFKMETLSFDSLRIALLDCAARVRLEDAVPESIPHFLGMKLEGGFLKDQIVHFSKNLTCIIGGRGAGKSTMLESLRVASGNGDGSPLIDSEVWPDSISLVYVDEVGQQHLLKRNKSGDVTNMTDPDGPMYAQIESYGQGQTAQTIHRCGEDPGILLQFLDDFVAMEDLEAEDTQLRLELLDNQTELEQLTLSINQIPDIQNAKNVAEAQVATLKSEKAGELVALEQKLAVERRFRDNLNTNLGKLLTSIKDGISSQELTNLFVGQDGANLAVGKDEFDQVKTLVTQLAGEVDKIAGQLQSAIADTAKKIVAQLKQWSTKETQTQEKIEELRRELEKQNIKLDMAFIRKVTKDATDYAAKLTELQKCLPKRVAAAKERQELISKRRRCKSLFFTRRQAFAQQMNKNLASTVVDYAVDIHFDEGLYSPEFEDFVKTAMGWRTSQVPKAKLLASSVSPLDLLQAVLKRDRGPIDAVKDANGNRVFGPQEAGEILLNMSTAEAKYKLARMPFQDRPQIRVTRQGTDASGKPVFQAKDFALLSLGQQQSILLSILLFSKSTTPLIIDQPEDNLDSEFIYKTLVRTLRSIKEQRQVIIVTHNANIAVLGDAELIIPLRGASEYSIVRDRGSIDTPTTKDIVCTILEGSKKAFKRRQELYGIA